MWGAKGESGPVPKRGIRATCGGNSAHVVQEALGRGAHVGIAVGGGGEGNTLAWWKGDCVAKQWEMEENSFIIAPEEGHARRWRSICVAPLVHVWPSGFRSWTALL